MIHWEVALCGPQVFKPRRSIMICFFKFCHPLNDVAASRFNMHEGEIGRNCVRKRDSQTLMQCLVHRKPYVKDCPLEEHLIELK